MSALADNADLARLFRRGFAATFALDLVTSALGAATVVVLVHELSVSTYAYTTLFLTFAQFAGAAASGGVRTSYLRLEAERVSRGRQGAVVEAFQESLVKGTLLIVVIGVCAAALAHAFEFGAGFGGGGGLILYATGLGVGFSAVELATAHYQARRRFFLAGSLRVLRAAALLGVSLVIATTSQSVLGVSLWFIGAMAVVGSLTVGAIAGRHLLALLSLRRVFTFRREEIWLSFYYVAAAGFAYVDVLVAGALLNKHQVATLGASLRYLAIILGAIPALGAILRVRTSQIDLVDSPVNQRAMVMGWARRAVLPTAVVVGAAMLLAPVVIPQIDGGRYPGSIEAFQVFLVGAFSAYLWAPAANVLMAQRRHGVLAAVYGTGLLINLIGDILVARRFGVVAIAIVSTTVFVAIDIAMVVCSLRRESSPKD